MRTRVVGTRLALAGFAGTTGLVFSTACASVPAPKAAFVACASLKVTATPALNAQNAPYESTTNVVTSCASAAETAVLVQKVPGLTRSKKWTIRLAPAQVVSSVSRIPYTCCGTYTVFDAVYSTSGALLGRGAASFTFA